MSSSLIPEDNRRRQREQASQYDSFVFNQSRDGEAGPGISAELQQKIVSRAPNSASATRTLLMLSGGPSRSQAQEDHSLDFGAPSHIQDSYDRELHAMRPELKQPVRGQMQRKMLRQQAHGVTHSKSGELKQKDQSSLRPSLLLDRQRVPASQVAVAKSYNHPAGKAEDKQDLRTTPKFRP